MIAAIPSKRWTECCTCITNLENHDNSSGRLGRFREQNYNRTFDHSPGELAIGQLSNNPRPASDPTVVAGYIIFLVRRMDRVIVETETDQQAIHAEDGPETAHYWNRTTAPHHHRSLLELVFQRCCRSLQIGSSSEISIAGLPLA